MATGFYIKGLFTCTRFTGMNFIMGSYEKLQPGFRDGKMPNILSTSFGAKCEILHPRENAISLPSTNPPESNLRAEVLSGMNFRTQKVVRDACQSRTTLLMLKAVTLVKVLFN